MKMHKNANEPMNFYEWYKYIHGNVPFHVMAKIDRHGNRRRNLVAMPFGELPDDWESMSSGERMLWRTAYLNAEKSDEIKFKRLMDQFKHSLVQNYKSHLPR